MATGNSSIEKMFIVRQSQHINEDVKRNWSSWNYGLEGLNCSADELDVAIETALATDTALYISGFELYGRELETAEIRELYENYWVLVDVFHGSGLSCNILNACNLEEAINIVEADNFFLDMQEGDMVDCSDAIVAYSKGEIHILEVK